MIDERLKWFLTIIEGAGGVVDTSSSALTVFYNDRGEELDTNNTSEKLGYTRSYRGTIKTTDAGREYLARIYCDDLYLVIGGEVVHPTTIKYRDPENIDFVGFFETYKEANDRWKANAWLTVDNAHMRYRVISVNPEVYNDYITTYLTDNRTIDDVERKLAKAYAAAQ